MPEQISQEEILRALRELIGRPDPVGFRRGQVPPPAPHFTTVADRLYIRSRCSTTGVVIGVAGRYLQPGGWPQTFSFAHTPNTNRTMALESYSLGEGFLLSLVAYVNTGAIRRGQCYVELGLLRGLEASGSERQVLLKEYISTRDAHGWPGGPMRSSIDGPGFVYDVAGTNPAAGVEITEAVPGEARWKVRGMTFTLVTAVGGVARQVHLLVDDGAAVLYRTVSASTQAAALTENYNAGAHGIAGAAVAGEHFLPIPDDLILPAGWRLLTATDNLAGGDDFGAPEIMVEEWIEE